jgi:hypothetical protein
VRIPAQPRALNPDQYSHLASEIGEEAGDGFQRYQRRGSFLAAWFDLATPLLASREKFSSLFVRHI